MGAVKSSKDIALLARETKNAQDKGKHNNKENIYIEFKPKEEFDPSNGASGSKKDKHKRFEKTKCSYGKKGNHSDKDRMKKTKDQMVRLLEQHHISLLEGARKIDPESKTNDHEIFHALKVGFSKSQSFLVDSGPSNHMFSSKESFSLLNLTDGPSIHMGDDTQI